jgi:Ca2+-binding RTX toxin-like protein
VELGGKESIYQKY